MASDKVKWGTYVHGHISDTQGETAFARTILVQGTDQTKMASDRSVGNHSNKGRPFRFVLPRAG